MKFFQRLSFKQECKVYHHCTTVVFKPSPTEKQNGEENLLQLTTLEKENKKDGRWLNTAYFSFKINQTSGRQCQAKSSRLHKLAKRYVKIYLSPAINRRDDKSAN
ncbi:hypothetical protein T09_11677 [Trichinella sp. T9]|nr:hypothetical protein T09_11677 [Trichinella sp. T9]